MSTVTTAPKSAPVYLALVAAVKDQALKMGIPLELTEGTATGLPENQRFVIFRSLLNGHKLHVPKSASRMGNSDTTVPTPLGTPLSDLRTRKGEVKVNGKVQQIISSDVDSIMEVLFQFADDSTKLPENKKPPGKAVPAPTEKFDMDSEGNIIKA